MEIEIMAYVTGAVSPREFTEPTKRTGRGFWQRFYAGLLESRQRAAEREIAFYVGANGNKFTDETERDIERMLSNPRW
jgi:hypothetical protein